VVAEKILLIRSIENLFKFVLKLHLYEEETKTDREEDIQFDSIKVDPTMKDIAKTLM